MTCAPDTGPSITCPLIARGEEDVLEDELEEDGVEELPQPDRAINNAGNNNHISGFVATLNFSFIGPPQWTHRFSRINTSSALVTLGGLVFCYLPRAISMNFPLIKQRHPSGMPEKRAMARPGSHPSPSLWRRLGLFCSACSCGLCGYPGYASQRGKMQLPSFRKLH